MSTLHFTDRVAVVTGAGGGLGRTYALELAARGAAVVVNDLGGSFDGKGSSTSMADQVVAEIKAAGGRAVACYDSVGTRTGGAALIATALDNFGRVDIVINNAGHLRNAPFDEIADDALDSILDVHLKGAFYVTQPAFAQMKKQGYGRVVFTSSASGVYGNALQAAYGAAKAGLIGLMNVLSLEGAEYGVRCNAVLPVGTTRMAHAMDAKQLEAFAALYAGFGQHIGNSHEQRFVTPLVVYLASEACRSSHAIYSSSLGRYARTFIGVTEGWVGPRMEPATAEEILAHIDQIDDTSHYFIPGSLADETAAIGQQLVKAAG